MRKRKAFSKFLKAGKAALIYWHLVVLVYISYLTPPPAIHIEMGRKTKERREIFWIPLSGKLGMHENSESGLFHPSRDPFVTLNTALGQFPRKNAP